MNEPQPADETLVKVGFLILLASVAWPALLAGYALKTGGKRYIPRYYWFLVTGFSILGMLLLFVVNVASLLHAALQDITPLILDFGLSALLRFLAHVWLVWLGSLCLFPLCTLLLELLSPRRMEDELLALERERHAIQERKSQRAAHKVLTAPYQIDGKAIMGVFIDDPSQREG